MNTKPQAIKKCCFKVMFYHDEVVKVIDKKDRQAQDLDIDKIATIFALFLWNLVTKGLEYFV